MLFFFSTLTSVHRAIIKPIPLHLKQSRILLISAASRRQSFQHPLHCSLGHESRLILNREKRIDKTHLKIRHGSPQSDHELQPRRTAWQKLFLVVPSWPTRTGQVQGDAIQHQYLQSVGLLDDAQQVFVIRRKMTEVETRQGCREVVPPLQIKTCRRRVAEW